MRGFLKENKDIFARVDAELRKKLGIKASDDVDVPAAPENGAEKAQDVVKAKR